MRHDDAVPATLAALSAAAPGDERRLADGTVLAVRRWGTGTPVVCLHAIGHGSGDFAELAARLGPGFELVAPDWPGMGRSPPDARPVRAEHYARLALALLDTLALPPAILLGNSIGGAAAILAAARAPARVRGVVLCNAAGLAPVDATARVAVRVMAACFRAGARGARWFPTAFGWYYRWLVLPGAPAHARREAVVRAAPALAAVLADAWTGFGEPGADLRAVAATLPMPVWLAWAADDRVVAYRRARAAIATIPRHTVTLFPGGHSPFLEAPAAFAAGFRAFARTLDDGAAT